MRFLTWLRIQPYRCTQLPFSGLLMVLLLFHAACAVLTESQVQEINRFGIAATNYGTLPGEPVEAYGILARYDRLLLLASAPKPTELKPGDENRTALINARKEEIEKSWQDLVKAGAAESSFKDSATAINKSLAFIKEYAEGLEKLTAAELLEDVDKAAESLGSSLDKAIGQYNEHVAKTESDKLGLVGGFTAAGVRGIGGLYISAKQTRYAKEFINEADPTIEKMMGTFGTALKELHDATTEQELRIKNNYKTLIERRAPLSPETILLFDRELQINRDVKQLTHKAITASESLATAHKALTSSIQKKETLSSRIKAIDNLIEHVKAGMALKKKLEKD